MIIFALIIGFVFGWVAHMFFTMIVCTYTHSGCVYCKGFKGLKNNDR